MKTSIPAFLLLLLAGGVFANPPKAKDVNSYNRLWANSPFTAKPPPPLPGEVTSPVDDWALGGVSEVDGGGYMVTIFHKKNAGETQVIRPRGTMVTAKDEMKWLEPGAPGSFKVERVEYGKDSWKDTVVHLSSGGKSDSVKFDDKMMAPTASAAPPPQNRPPGQPGQAGQPGQPGQPGAQNVPGVINPQNPGVRPPRQRITLPNNPNQNQQRPNR